MAKVIRTSRYAPRLGTGYSGSTTETLNPGDYRFTTVPSNVLFRFNETDTTQIGTRVVPCALNTTPISSETLTVVTNTNGVGTRLRFQLTFATSSVTTNAGLWPLLDDTGNPFTLPDRFIVRMRFAHATLTNVTNFFLGFGVWNNSSSTPYGVFIMQHSTGNATVVGRVQNSDGATTTRPWAALSTTAAGATWNLANNIDYAGSAYQWKFNLTQGAGGNPFMANATYEMVSGGGASTQTAPTMIPAARSAAGSAFQTIATTIDSGFNDKTCNYPMLCFLAQTGTGTKTVDAEIADLEILVDPMDLP